MSEIEPIVTSSDALVVDFEDDAELLPSTISYSNSSSSDNPEYDCYILLQRLIDHPEIVKSYGFAVVGDASHDFILHQVCVVPEGELHKKNGFELLHSIMGLVNQYSIKNYYLYDSSSSEFTGKARYFGVRFKTVAKDSSPIVELNNLIHNEIRFSTRRSKRFVRLDEDFDVLIYVDATSNDTSKTSGFGYSFVVRDNDVVKTIGRGNRLLGYHKNITVLEEQAIRYVVQLCYKLFHRYPTVVFSDSKDACLKTSREYSSLTTIEWVQRETEGIRDVHALSQKVHQGTFEEHFEFEYLFPVIDGLRRENEKIRYLLRSKSVISLFKRVFFR